MGGIERRLRQLEERNDPFSDVKRILAEHRFYDELTDREKDRFAQYLNIDRALYEQGFQVIFGDLHHICQAVEAFDKKELESIIADFSIQKGRDNG